MKDDEYVYVIWEWYNNVGEEFNSRCDNNYFLFFDFIKYDFYKDIRKK